MSSISREEITNAIFGQESSHGKADTSKENYARARGPMQVTFDTFEGLKRNGLIPKDYRHDNPEHTTQAGNALVSYLYDKFEGDPRKVAAAYYAGEKAVREDGTIRNYSDKKNPSAPTTQQYVTQVMNRLGQETVFNQPAAKSADRASVLDSWSDGMPDRTAVAKASKAVAGTPDTPITPFPKTDTTGVASLADQIEAEEQVHRAASAKREGTEFIEQSRAAFMQNTFAGSAIRHMALAQAASDLKPQPGWALDPKELAGFDSSEQGMLKQAHSPEHLEKIKWEINDRRQQLETVNIKGTGVGIAATLFAGLPEGYLTGMGAMRSFQIAKVGAMQLAAQGQKASAVASAVAENVGANGVLTAV